MFQFWGIITVTTHRLIKTLKTAPGGRFFGKTENSKVILKHITPKSRIWQLQFYDILFQR